MADPQFLPSMVPLAVPTEAEIKERIRAAQKKMGIMTEDEYDPLAPGASEDELWPAQPWEPWIDFRLA